MTGVTIGFSAGPPLGGLLYQKLGFRAPFVFCLCLTALDFIGRIIVIEPRDVRQWTEADAEALSQTGNVADVEKQHNTSDSPRLPPAPALVVSDPDMVEVSAPEEKGNSSEVPKTSSKAEEADAEKVDQLPLASTEIVEISKPLSYLEATWQILKSGRGMAALVNTLLYGVLMTSLEPTFTLRLQAVWNLSSLRVGLIYLAGAVPAFFSGAIAGWSADVYGAEWATTICLLLSFPWYMLLIIKGHLAFFIVCFCLAMFLLNGMVSPATSELAAVSRNLPGVTYAHVFGGFNMCYSIGSAIGPIIGGQVYDGVKNGWVVLMIINTCIISCCAMVTLALTGNDPILQRIARSLRRSRIDSD
ncbi:MFS general substrate transporter [Clavulina sp. PMI_390]|nr:MFS general substrate transporter [Clavulina sp. PMI_390]